MFKIGGEDLKTWGKGLAAEMHAKAIGEKARTMGKHVYRFNGLSNAAWNFALLVGGDVRMVEGVGVDGQPRPVAILVGFDDEDAAIRFRLRWGGELVQSDKYS